MCFVKPPRIAVIDNYDSFTFNLVQAIGAWLDGRGQVAVWRNDSVTVDELERWRPTHLVVSPGPCTPRESGVSRQALHRFMGHIPALGVCLGHQCIADMFGAVVERAERIVHGKTSRIFHDHRDLFFGLPDGFAATRYHSLIVRPDSLPPELEVCAWTDRGEIMGLRHRSFALEGVQFHPESYLTVHGPRLLANFLALTSGVRASQVARHAHPPAPAAHPLAPAVSPVS